MSRMNQTRDMQALAFGINSANSQKAFNGAGTLGTITNGPPITVILGSNSAAANDLQGQVLITTATSATWASANVIWGTILSNTLASPTTATIDNWYVIGTNAIGGPPATSALYVVMPCAAPFWYFALSDSVSSVAGTETGTAMGGTELSASGLGRTIATTLTHTAGASTGTVGVTFTYTGSSAQAIGRVMIANSVTAAASSGRGNFGFFIDQINSGTAATVSANGDTLQVTDTITYATVP